jgi:hypothetical protein
VAAVGRRALQQRRPFATAAAATGDALSLPPSRSSGARGQLQQAAEVRRRRRRARRWRRRRRARRRRWARRWRWRWRRSATTSATALLIRRLRPWQPSDQQPVPSLRCGVYTSQLPSKLRDQRPTTLRSRCRCQRRGRCEESADQAERPVSLPIESL